MKHLDSITNIIIGLGFIIGFPVVGTSILNASYGWPLGLGFLVTGSITAIAVYLSFKENQKKEDELNAAVQAEKREKDEYVRKLQERSAILHARHLHNMDPEKYPDYPELPPAVPPIKMK